MDRRSALVFGLVVPALAVRAQARKARIGLLNGALGPAIPQPLRLRADEVIE